MPTLVKPAATAKSSALLPLVLVFLCGVSVGALVMSLGFHDRFHSSVLPSKPPIPMTVERWKKDLNLTPSQTAQIEQILDDFSKYYDNVLADGNSRILLVLDDSQKIKFQRMLKDRR